MDELILTSSSTQRNVEVFNETLGRVVPAADRKIKVEWADCPNNVQSHYRHMWNRVERTTSGMNLVREITAISDKLTTS